jgi:hypothetical protein
MRFFQKKKKDVEAIGAKRFNEALMEAIGTKQRIKVCPPLLKNSGVCACIDCPKNETCFVEKWNHDVFECKQFVTNCSFKMVITNSDKLSGYEDFFLNPFYQEKFGYDTRKINRIVSVPTNYNGEEREYNVEEK